VIVTHGFALLLLVPVALLVGALIPLFMWPAAVPNGRVGSR
jgi:hypothetical protein